MNNICDIIIIIEILIDIFLYISSNIHIYQLNHYKAKSQLKWIKSNCKKILLKSSLFLLSLLLVIFTGIIGKIVTIILLAVLIFIEKPKKAKIPLVYTARVKRLIITEYIIVILGIIIFQLNLGLNSVLYFCLATILITPVMIFVLDLINKPINKFINFLFIKDAKKIIKSMPNLIVIGVTGSYGKTSVKNFLYKILSAKYNVLMTPGNYNTTLGVVKTIRNDLKATHDIFICEMGACQKGDIKEICDIVHPKYGIISSIGPQHLESFKNMETVVKTKFELVDSLPEDGIAFLNFDNEFIKNNKTNKKVISYGVENKEVEDFYGYDISATNKGLNFKMLDENKEEKVFSTKILGKQNITNIVGCIAIARTLGIPMELIIQRVKMIESVEHRLKLLKMNGNLIIDDAYNSNPSGSKYALETLNMFDGMKIIITPGMIELGEKQTECNFEFGKQISKICDYVILVGKKQTKPIYEGIISENYNKEKIKIMEDVKEAINFANAINSKDKIKIILLENDLPDNY